MIEWIHHRPPRACNETEILVAERLKVLADSLICGVWRERPVRPGRLCLRPDLPGRSAPPSHPRHSYHPDWYAARHEGLGNLEEGLSRKNTEESKSSFGRHFTSQSLVNMMVAVMKPRVGEHGNNFAAGTFGSIITPQLFISKRIPRSRIHPIMAGLRIFMRIADFIRLLKK